MAAMPASAITRHALSALAERSVSEIGGISAFIAASIPE
jgi:hypothetical protein